MAKEVFKTSDPLFEAVFPLAQRLKGAESPADVFRLTVETIAGHHGFSASIFAREGGELVLKNLAFPVSRVGLLDRAQGAVGLQAQGYRIPIAENGFFESLITEGDAVFCSSDEAIRSVTEALPAEMHPQADALIGFIGIGPVIYVPLSFNNTAYILRISGSGITTDHLPVARHLRDEMVEHLGRAEERQKSKEELADLVEELSIGLFRSTPEDGRLILANPALARILGYGSVEELLEELQNVDSIYVNSEERRRYLALMEEQGHVTEFKYRVRKKDGTVIWLSEDGRVGEDDGKKYYEGFVRDVTEEKVLKGMLPICSYCHKIRDETGNWRNPADYMTLHSETEFTHGICPNCNETIVKPQMEEFRKNRQK